MGHFYLVPRIEPAGSIKRIPTILPSLGTERSMETPCFLVEKDEYDWVSWESRRSDVSGTDGKWYT